MPERAPECPNCGSKAPKRARFCPECGTRLGDDASVKDTAALETPVEETGPVPVDVTSVEPRWFGVTPPMLAFALAVAALAVGVLLLATGRVLAGVLAVAAAFLFFVAFAQVVRRRPGTPAARASAGVFGHVRARAGFAVDAVATRSRAAREIGRLRNEVLGLRGARERLLRELGEAVYRDDRKGTKRLRGELTELDARIEGKEGEMATIAAEARERIGRARLQVQPTELVEVPEPGGPSPEPPTPAPDPGIPAPTPVPEPSPTPIPEPSPTPVPEPYPPPDEATPPEPARVPEPGPLGQKRKKK